MKIYRFLTGPDDSSFSRSKRGAYMPNSKQPLA